MRESDKTEIWASGGFEPIRGLRLSVEASDRVWTGLVNGEPVCCFGRAVSPVDPTVGYPWLLGTPVMERHSKAFLIRNRAYLREMSRGLRRLENHVFTENRTSIRWLKWLGFIVDEPAPFGTMGMTFHKFWMDIDHV